LSRLIVSASGSPSPDHALRRRRRRPDAAATGTRLAGAAFPFLGRAKRVGHMDEIEIPVRGVCPKCGSVDVEIPPGARPETIVVCPNCGFRAKLADLFKEEKDDSR
jgi:hypothetical protein